MLKLSDEQILERLKRIPANPSAENGLFSDPGIVPGRVFDAATGRVLHPEESLKGYEELLDQIKRVAPERYSIMHKGTPFYLMGWLAYEMRNYEKGVFYMDAALSEDVHNDSIGWVCLPAAAFIFLNDKHPNAAANEITTQARREVQSHLMRFSSESGLGLDIDVLVNKFFKPYAKDLAHRSIITSLLTFLKEGKDHLQLQMRLRSHHGGSLEPFLTHLFKGGLIFESLLKRKYGAAVSRKILGKYLEVAQSDLALSNKIYRNKNEYDFQEIPTLLQNWERENFQERTIAIAYAVRNTTGHDLGWQDIFTEDIYNKLFEGIVDAIFWVIKKAYNV